jgi:hypothetical protein
LPHLFHEDIDHEDNQIDALDHGYENIYVLDDIR